MKFNKTMLFTALAASSVLLTACDDKATSTASTAQANTQQATQANINDVVAISGTKYDVVREANAEPKIVIKSQLKNTSGKEIASARWKTSLVLNGTTILFTDPTFTFTPAIKAQGTNDTFVTVTESNIIPANRPFIFTPSTPISYKIELLEVTFTDGTKVTAK